MIKRYTITLLLFIGLASSSTYAKGFRYRENFITGSGSAGYSLLNYSTNSLSDGKLGYSLDFGHTWKLESDVFFSVAGGISRLSSQIYSDTPHPNPRYPMIDNDQPADTFALRSTFEGVNEFVNVLYFNLHPSIGYTFRNRTYCIVGLKMGYNLTAKSESETSVTTTAEYDKYEGIFSDMPEYGLISDKPISSSSKLDMGINMSATFEYGSEIHLPGLEKSHHLIKAGIFLDYGFLNIYKAEPTNGSVFSYDKDDLTNFTLNSTLTDKTSTGSLNTIYSGVKLTYYYNTKRAWVPGARKNKKISNKKVSKTTRKMKKRRKTKALKRR